MYPNLWRHNGRIVGFRHFGHNALHNGRSGLYGGNGSPGEDTPSFDLPLANMSSGVFTIAPRTARGSSTPTFTRATAATTIDFEGLLKTCLSGEARCLGGRRVANLVPNSEVLTAAAGWSVQAGLTVTSGVTDPQGGATAYSLTVSTAGAKQFYKGITGFASGTQYRDSWWIRASVLTGTCKWLNSSGTAGNTVPLTSSWQRLADVVKTTNSATMWVGFELSTQNDVVELWRPLVEDVTGQSNQNPSEYVSVGVLSAPTYHGVGVDGVKVFTTLNGNTVASNVVTEATGAAITSAQGACAGGVTAGVVDAVGPVGFLPEGARTNAIVQSQDLTTTWLSIGGAGTPFTANTTVAPDGTTTMDTFTEDTGTSAHKFYQAQALAAGATAGSCWLAPGTRRYVIVAIVGTNNVYCVVDTQTWTITETGGTGTYTSSSVGGAGVGTARRITLVGTVTNAGSSFFQIQGSNSATPGAIDPSYLGNSSTIIAWGAQLEAAAFASTYIPTTTVAVARNADVLTYVATSNMPASGQPETWFCEVTRNNTGQEAGGILGGNQDFRVLLVQSEAGGSKGYTYHDAAATGPALTAAGITSNTATKLAFVYNGSTVTTYKDGTAGTPVAMGAQGSNATVLVVGALANGTAPLFAAIRSIKIIPRALSTAQVAAL